jgi:hypothetical protein
MRMIRVCQTHLGCARHHIAKSPKAYFRRLKELKAGHHQFSQAGPIAYDRCPERINETLGWN